MTDSNQLESANIGIDPTKPTGQLRPSAEYRLRRYEARLGLFKVIWGTAVVGVAAAAFPFASELAKTYTDRWKSQEQTALEREKLQLQIALEGAKLKLQKETARQQFIQTFANTGYNQDIELRMRFAEYFAFVADPLDRPDWEAFRLKLEERREKIRGEIEKRREELAKERGKKAPDEVEIAKLERRIRWYEAELSPAPLNEPVTVAKARTEDEGGSTARSRLIDLFQKQPDRTPPDTSFLRSRFPAPVSDISKAKSGACPKPDNPEYTKLLETIKINSKSEIVLLRPLADKFKKDLADMKVALPKIANEGIFDSGQCVYVIGNELDNESWHISFDAYLDKNDRRSDIERWSNDKIEQYEKLIQFMSSKDWIWTRTPFIGASQSGNRPFLSTFSISKKSLETLVPVRQ
jgi:hypothetical protein